MKKYIFLLFVAFCLIMIGCTEKNTPSNSAETKKYGYIQVVNNSTSPYLISIKGNTSLTFTIDGQQWITNKVEVGYYNVNVKQKSGYLLYPTVHDYEVYVEENKTELISFTTTL